MTVVNFKQNGHTLVELLIALLLSLVIIGAFVPINNLSVKAIDHYQYVQAIINKLRQSVRLLKTDLQLTGMTGCLQNKYLINDRISETTSGLGHGFNHSWISVLAGKTWHPDKPKFDHNNLDTNNSAIHLLNADISNPLTPNQATTNEKQILFITNCLFAEISTAMNSRLINSAYSSHQLYIYPFTTLLYHLKENESGFTLYREFITKTGKSRNEPVFNNILTMKFGFAEELSVSSLAFRSANNVTDWNKIVAVYVFVEIQIKHTHFDISIIVPLQNHE